MQQLQITAPAKINLSLDIVGRRKDGYHLLATVMQSLSLADLVTVSVDHDGHDIKLCCDQPNIPCDQRNTAHRAARIFADTSGISMSVKIDIRKRIPSSAGLAGGSTDAAAVLFALSHLHPGRVKITELMDMALQIGADVPFCLHGGTVLCEGIGENLKPLPSFSGIPVLLVNPGFSVSTPWAFQQFDHTKQGRRPDTSKVIQAMCRNDLSGIAEHTSNVLEQVTLASYPVLNEYKDELRASGAQVVQMSGSGPTIFALYSDAGQRDRARDYISGILPSSACIIASETRASGPVIIKQVFN